jgi:hypothetical protein
MMHLWDTKALGDEIAFGRVTSKEKAAYFVLAAVFYLAIGYIAGYGPSHYSWIYVYEALVVCVVTLAGANKVASAYPEPIGESADRIGAVRTSRFVLVQSSERLASLRCRDHHRSRILVSPRPPHWPRRQNSGA